MEFAIFPRLAPLLDRFVELRLHTDHRDSAKSEAFKKYQLELTKGLGLPTYVVVDPNAPDEAIAIFFGADRSGAKFAAFLREHAGTPSE